MYTYDIAPQDGDGTMSCSTWYASKWCCLGVPQHRRSNGHLLASDIDRPVELVCELENGPVEIVDLP